MIHTMRQLVFTIGSIHTLLSADNELKMKPIGYTEDSYLYITIWNHLLCFENEFPMVLG